MLRFSLLLLRFRGFCLIAAALYASAAPAKTTFGRLPLSAGFRLPFIGRQAHFSFVISILSQGRQIIMIFPISLFVMISAAFGPPMS